MRITAGSMVARPDEIAVAVLGHPMSAGEMSGVNALCAIGLLGRVEAEDDTRHLLPVSAFGFRIEQAKIGHEMTAVILGQLVASRRRFLKIVLRHIDPR